MLRPTTPRWNTKDRGVESLVNSTARFTGLFFRLPILILTLKEDEEEFLKVTIEKM